MMMSELIELINSIASIITALATLGMLGVAVFALYTWRKEFIGKKKIELASEIMVTVFEFQDMLMQSRINMYTSKEIDEIKKWLDEVNYQKRLDTNSVSWPIYSDRMHCLLPFHRLNKNSDIIDEFSMLLTRSLIYWDENLFRLLQELHSFLGKIRYASEMLYENQGDADLQQIAFSNKPTDDLSTRIFEIGDEIKLNLEPIYKDKRSPWKKLKKAKVVKNGK